MEHAPYRRLWLTSPLMGGEDVRRFQVGLNARGRARGVQTIEADGVYGPETVHAYRQIGPMLGLARSTVEDGATIGAQRVIRAPNRYRTPAMLVRAARWREAASKGSGAALSWAVSKIGIKEQPANSNTGPEIEDWQKAANMGPGPWCGAFAKACADHGGATITPEARYTPWIIAHAKARTGGYEGWVPVTDELANPGDHVLFSWNGDSFPEHVGVLESVDLAGHTVTTIDGNTSMTGSQDNGGAVLRRTRPFSMVVGVARVRWP